MYKVDAMFDFVLQSGNGPSCIRPVLRPALRAGFPVRRSGVAEPESGLTLDFKDADIHASSKYISEATGRNFITDPTVKGR